MSKRTSSDANGDLSAEAFYERMSALARDRLASTSYD